MAKPKLLTTAQAAAEFDLSRAYVARLCEQQKVTAEKLGRDWLIDRKSMEAYAASWQQRKPGPRRKEKQPDD